MADSNLNCFLKFDIYYSKGSRSRIGGKKHEICSDAFGGHNFVTLQVGK